MKRIFSLMLAAAFTLPVAGMVGCDEEVMEVETPTGEVEVERDVGTGELEVDK
ncbi:MAG: hypothetical protein KY475_12305 [Planctomycetes bacterium]|nr:hypothetical protein [Planctomycetota bacterium]